MLIVVKIPLLGKAAVLFNSYFFSLQLSSLLKSGLSIYDSLTAFKEQSFLPFYREEAEMLITRLKAGETIESALSGHPCYEKILRLQSATDRQTACFTANFIRTASL